VASHQLNCGQTQTEQAAFTNIRGAPSAILHVPEGRWMEHKRFSLNIHSEIHEGHLPEESFT
jgi:hypothetical protein